MAYADVNGINLYYESHGAGRPLILLLDLRGFKHFVVLKGMTDEKILVGDPMLGLTQYKWSEFERYWNGVVLAVMRTPVRRSQRARSRSVTRST